LLESADGHWRSIISTAAKGIHPPPARISARSSAHKSEHDSDGTLQAAKPVHGFDAGSAAHDCP